jgi:hypothetical protein
MSENGFLTERDRKFLLGEKEYTGENAKQMRYQARRAIRERARAALFDMQLLFDVLDEHELEKVFQLPQEPDDVDERAEFKGALEDTLAYLYLGVGALQQQPRGWASFRHYVEKGVLRAESKRSDDPHAGAEILVDVSIEHYHPSEADVNEALEKIAEGRERELTERELRAFLQQLFFAEPGREELVDAVDEHLHRHRQGDESDE